MLGVMSVVSGNTRSDGSALAAITNTGSHSQWPPSCPQPWHTLSGRLSAGRGMAALTVSHG